MASPAGRRGLAAGSPAFFDTYYCGMRQADHRRRWLDLAEQTITQARRKRSKGRVLLLAPRDHGKTELAISIALRAVCLNRNIRILWISESSTAARKRVMRLRTLLQSPRVVEDWESAPSVGCGPFRQPNADGEKPKWTETQIYVTRTLASVDPTIEAVGTGGGITGGHFDLILCDDLEDDRTVFSAAQRAKTRNWWRGTMLPMLSKGGTIMVIGTRKHHDDLYAHLKKSAAWRTIEDKAILGPIPKHKVHTHWDERTQEEVIDRVEVLEPVNVLWPEERPIEYLLEERYVMTTLVFSREFQHEVQDDTNAAYRMDWLEAAKARGRHLRLGQMPPGVDLLVVQGWDLALVDDEAKAEAQDSDFSVGMTIGRCKQTGDRYLLGIYRQRGMTPGAIRGAVLGQFQSFGGLSTVRAVAVERNAFGNLHYMGLQKTTDLPLKPHMTTGAKKADPWDGVASMGNHFENGKWVLPYHEDDEAGRALVDVLVAELWGLGKEKHDDTVLALWIAELALRSSNFTHRIASEDGVMENDGTVYDEPETVRADNIRAERLWDDLAGMLPDAFRDADDFDDDDDEEDDPWP